MHEPGTLCTELIKETADALNNDRVALMLIAVQRENLEMAILISLQR